MPTSYKDLLLQMPNIDFARDSLILNASQILTNSINKAYTFKWINFPQGNWCNTGTVKESLQTIIITCDQLVRRIPAYA